jgi:hypothetical protein
MRRSILAAALVLAALPAVAHAQTAACSDSELTQLITEVAGRAPHGAEESGECNANLYGGHWGSTSELRGRVRRAFGAMRIAGVSFEAGEGDVMKDVRMNMDVEASAMFVGPRSIAPKGLYYVELPNGYAIAFQRGERALIARTAPAVTTGSAAVASSEARPEQR